MTATATAQAWETGLRARGLKATCDPRNVNLPGVLIVPVPSRTYDLMCDSYTAAWTIVCLSPGVGDLSDAESLEAIADDVVEWFSDNGHAVTTVEAASYVLPNQPDPKPALLVRLETTEE